MTNREKYAEQIVDIAINDVIIAVDKKGRVHNCNAINCSDCMWDGCLKSCGDKLKEWAEQEYAEPAVDWSKVPVDAKILVKQTHDKTWEKRHFATCVNGLVYAWPDGKTSYTSDKSDFPALWDCAKLAEEDV